MTWKRIEQLAFLLTWSLFGIGLCLMLGLFTRPAALAGAGFMLFVVMSQPSYPGVYPLDPPQLGHALLVNKDFVEMIALLVIASTSLGRWTGLDFFIHNFLIKPFLLLQVLQRHHERRTKSMSNSPEVSRRDFLKAGVAAGAVAGVGLGGFYFGYNAAIGSPVRVGVIGTGDEGSVLIGALKPEFIEVKAIADIRPFNQFRAFHGDWTNKDNKPSLLPVRPGLMSIYGWKTETEAKKHVKVYGPYQELLENAKKDGIEAIIIATPLHLHAPIAIAAMKQGLHVITEKLMAQTVGQCKEMTRVADDEKLYLAIGHQRHYNIKYWQAKDWIQRGAAGRRALHSRPMASRQSAAAVQR